MELARALGLASRESTRASAGMDEAVVAALGLNATDGRACDLIDQQGVLTAGELAEQLGLTTGAVTALLDRLEAAGMVERVRDATDRRRVHVRGTEVGRELFAAIYTPFKTAWMTAGQDLTDEEMRAATKFQLMSKDLNDAFAARLREIPHSKAATPAERLALIHESLATFDASALGQRRDDAD